MNYYAEDHFSVFHNGKWAVLGAGNQKVTPVHSPQQLVIDPKEFACNQKNEFVIYRPNGQIRDKDSQGKDLFPPKG